jgi:putative ABC transport system substrate-binding protein
MNTGSVGLALAFAIGALVSSAGDAQPQATIVRIGYLSQLSEADDATNREAFRQGLSALGYVDGRNAKIEARYANGQLEKLPDLAVEIARMNVDVIVAAPTPAVRAIQQATRSIPIVMAFVGDPVGDGFVSSLARPGGTITGLSAAVSEMAVKRIEFLKVVLPKVSHVALLAPPQSQGTVVTETVGAGQVLGVQVITMSVRDAADVDRSFAAMPAAGVEGVIVNLSLRQHTEQIVHAALSRRLPTVSSERHFVAAGGLLAYGPDYPDLYRRAAAYVDKILKGAKPADLPVEQPTKFELAINLKTAKSLGVTIPQSLLLRADHVVQ